MNIAVVILNWNGNALLQKFLPSVIEHSNQATIYLADNASDDNSVDFVTYNFPSVKIIRNTTNGGFARGYNEALKNIDADIYCLLNNDVEVTENWLQPILDIFQNDPETSIVQPKILDFNRKDYFEYAGAAGGFIDKYGFPYCKGRLFKTIEKDLGQYDETSDILWASGACFFIRKNIFDQLEGLDESFFAHMEEIDLCWRAFNLGYKIKYVGHSHVFHVGGATLSENNPKKTYLNFRNSLFMITKNVSSDKLFTTLMVRLCQDGLASGKFLIEGKPLHALAVLRSHIKFYTVVSKLLKKRKAPLKQIKYYHKRSIVWSYYVNKKKTFNSL